MKQLHIMNGDASASILSQTKIEGDVAVFREMLVEGPTVYDIGSPLSYQTRSTFIENYFGFDASGYAEKIGTEFDKIKNANAYEEVVLWFEYDLFCQVNLCACIAFIAPIISPSTKLTLVCSGIEKGYSKKMGLGELTPEYYSTLLSKREEITTKEIEISKSFWKIYCSNDHIPLTPFLTADNGVLKYLASSLTEHFLRFPNPTTGVNFIEHKILELLNVAQLTQHQLIGKLLQWQDWLGFGDLQFDYYIRQLNDLYTINEKLEINASGIEILSNKTPYSGSRILYMGGTNSQNHNFDGKELM